MISRLVITALLALASAHGVAAVAPAPVRLVYEIVWQSDSEDHQEEATAASSEPRRTLLPSLYRPLPRPEPGAEYSLFNARRPHGPSPL